MDPVTHGLLGAAFGALDSSRRRQLVRGAAIAGSAALTPDLDLLIRSATDPVLSLEYHRAFSHSFAFAFVLAAVVALAWRPWTRQSLSFAAVFWLALIGVVSHVLLDACTTFGTEMFWPWSMERIAASAIAAFDPLFTVPFAVLLSSSLRSGRLRGAYAAVAWAVLYLSLGALQHARAVDGAMDLAASRGHVPTRLLATPSLGNTVLWKTIYEADGRLFVDAVRTGVARTVLPGRDIAALDVPVAFPQLDPGSQQARDIERFRRVAGGYVALDPEHADRVIDLRYSLVPNEIEGFWAIVVDVYSAPTAHVGFINTREGTPAAARRLLAMLFSPN